MLVPLLHPPGPPDGPALVVHVRGSRVFLADAEEPGPGLFLGTLEGRHCWAVDLNDAGPGDAGTGDSGAGDSGAGRARAVPTEDSFVDLRLLWGRVEETVWTLAGRAVQLVEWDRTHRFCGRCATPTEPASGERARRCPSCGLLAFPRLAPAVIVLVERDDGKALLARNVNFPSSMYSCLAGFVEPGETLEEAVRREVREEVGVELDRVDYWGSQPWPFPHSLMIGFLARWASGDIVCQADEIAEARWFSPGELPDIPPGISIAWRLIEDWLARAG